MTGYVIPVLFLTVLVASFVRKKDAYGMFVEGSRGAVDLMVSVFPYLLTVMVAVEVFKASGVSALVAGWLSPVMRVFGLPPELTELMILRPLSGAGSLAVLDNIYTVYGADTYIGRCASVIYGSSETIFYISAIYTSRIELKRLRYAIPVALVSTFAGCVVGCLILRL